MKYFDLDDITPDGTFTVPSTGSYNIRKLIKEYTEEEIELFIYSDRPVEV